MNKISHMIWRNLNNLDVQNQIKAICKGKSGVYRITNLINKKTYIGSAITKTPKGNRLYFRFRNHFFNHHKLFPVKRAICKYGTHNFSWEILEFTDISVTRKRETYWIQTLRPDYNILESAENSLGYCHTAETREKMKKNYSELRRQRIGALNKGKILARDVIEKISQAAQNKTLEQKQAHQKACLAFNKKKFSKLTQILDGDTLQQISVYPSLIKACRAWNGNYRTFKKAVKSGLKIKKFNIYVKYSS